MPSLKSIRKRIVSVKNTQKITKAMKMVAAAKLRRAQEAVVAVRPYARRMKGVVHDLVSRVGDDLELGAAEEAPEVLTEGGEGEARAQVVRDQLRLLRTGEEQRVLLVAVTSDRGLAGAFNSNVNRRVERFLVEQAGKQVQVVGVGKKGRDYLDQHAEDPVLCAAVLQGRVGETLRLDGTAVQRLGVL